MNSPHTVVRLAPKTGPKAQASNRAWQNVWSTQLLGAPEQRPSDGFSTCWYLKMWGKRDKTWPPKMVQDGSRV